MFPALLASVCCKLVCPDALKSDSVGDHHQGSVGSLFCDAVGEVVGVGSDGEAELVGGEGGPLGNVGMEADHCGVVHACGEEGKREEECGKNCGD